MTATSPLTEHIVVRALAADDVAFAALLHAEALPHGFFARLGLPFLRVYYESFIASPHAEALLAQVDGRRAGVIVGALRNRAHHRWVVRQRWWRLAPRAALALLRRPRLAAHFLRTRSGRYLKAARRLLRASTSAQAGHDEQAGDGHAVAVLSHVSVAADARGRGVGGSLVDAFVAAARDAGVAEVHLVTLADGNGAGAFYARHGWRHCEERTDVEDRRISAYVRSLR